MNALPQNAILEFNPNQLIEVRKLFGYEDLHRLQQDIEILKNWIQKQEHFVIKDYDEAYLERYLICNKGSVERAKKRFDKLCTLRGLMPEYLQGFDIKNEFHKTLQISYACILPKPTPDNYRLIVNSIYNPDTSMYEFKDVIRYMLVIVAYLSIYDYNAGFEIICDTTHFTLSIVAKLNPILISNLFMLITEALGLRVKGLHFITGSKALELFVAILKQGLSKKLTSRMHVHDSYESMYKYIPKEILPKDIGGDLPINLKDIADSNFKEFSSPEFVKIMKDMENAITNESKRLTSTFNENYSGMPGSFKVLNVD